MKLIQFDPKTLVKGIKMKQRKYDKRKNIT